MSRIVNEPLGAREIFAAVCLTSRRRIELNSLRVYSEISLLFFTLLPNDFEKCNDENDEAEKIAKKLRSTYERLPLSLGNFQEIVNRGHTRFGKSTNLTMLRDFFAFPVHPDSLELRKELFKESNILKEEPDLFTGHFCKFPVLYLSFTDVYGQTWKEMQSVLRGFFATLYADYIYVTEVLIIPQFHDIFSQQVAIKPESILFNLFKYLKMYANTQLENGNKYIILIDEYDCSVNNTYQNDYFEEANVFFGTLYSSLLKMRAIIIKVIYDLILTNIFKIG
ncbi:9265_t:CDS:2 [Ambispora leptoticha]|uniref:9265_t:CDS:1 n=1 Tax=Ambispora leptoticha TaxID=144679 RepID=A0A9N9C7I4_9GLOM|nr:9265_t:CDS:2 [Ambispora leptoticha]